LETKTTKHNSNPQLETKASPRRQCSTGRILSRAYAAIREWS